ncbi:hypothetical protein FG99_01285 [Pseudomonas sp. AAC]|nr:hypothetical protein FG99_01285 [Pseudomonas sp. AAC]OBY48806.1 hypothetical protein A9513_034490 [Pseudomonas sp. AU12215]
MHMSAVIDTPVDPILRRFTERQRAVATTWATHFGLAGRQRTDFIRTYLQRTSTARAWFVNGTHGPDQTPFGIARFGNTLQWYDGQIIRALTISTRDRVSLRKPTRNGAIALISRLESELRWHQAGGVFADTAFLTSYCKKAHQLAGSMATDDLGKFARNVPSPAQRGSHHRYFGPRTRFYLKQIGAVLKGFCSQLDPEILFAIRSVRCPSPALYNWLASGCKERRQQALKAQPILLPLLVLPDQISWPCSATGTFLQVPWLDLAPYELTDLHKEYLAPVAFDQMLGHTVDAGLSLTDFLAWYFQVQPSSIRFIGSCRPSIAGGALAHVLREGKNSGWHALLAGASLGNRRPKTHGDWTVFFQLFNHIPWEVRPDYSLPKDQQRWDLNRLLSGCPSSWNDPAWPRIMASLQDFGEVFRQLGLAFANHAQYDVIQQAKLNASAFFQRSSYRQLANKVSAFHKALAEIREEIDAEKPELKASDESARWTPLLVDGPVLCPNGIEAVELLSPSDLWSEHVSLDHCIDSYDFSAYCGDCRLISLRRDGRSLASAELVLNRKSHEHQGARTVHHLECAQLRSYGNDPVPKDSAEGRAFAWLMQQIKAGSVQVNLDWPDHTQHMTRFADSHWQSRLAGAVAHWVSTHLEAA